MKYIEFPRLDRQNQWYIGAHTWRKMTEETKSKFRAFREALKPCKLRIDVEPYTLGDP